MCRATSEKIQTPAGCNWCVYPLLTKLHWAPADETSVARYLLRPVIPALTGDRPWRFERGVSVSFSLGQLLPVISHRPRSQDNILVDKSGSAHLNDFEFTGIVSSNLTETSVAGLKGSHQWIAPELFETDGSCPRTNASQSGLSRSASDVFTLGMVTFEVSNTRHRRLFQCYNTVLHLLQAFTGQVPFPENRASAVLTKKLVDGERPQRTPKRRKLGLSDKSWEIARSSLVHKAKRRPPVGTFAGF